MQKYLNLTLFPALKPPISMDLPESGVPIELTFAARDKDSLDKNTGGRTSRSLDLPATKVNIEAFANIDKPGQDNEQDGAVLIPCVFTANGTPLLRGSIQAREAERGGGFYERNPDRIKAAIFGDNADVFNRIGGLRLSELDWTNETHTFSEANILTGISASRTALSADWVYILMKLEDWKYNSGGIVAPDISQFTPALFIRNIARKIFAHAGVDMKCDWLDNLPGTRYILPLPIPPRLPEAYSADYLNASAERVGARNYAFPLIAAGVDYTAILTQPNIGPNPITLSGVSPFLPNTGFYTVPQAGFYKVNFSFVPDNIVGSFTLQVVIFDHIGAFPGGGAEAFALSPAMNGETFSQSFVYEMPAGGVLAVYFGFSGMASGESFDLTYARFEVIGEAKSELGIELNFKYLLKDWTCRDFLRGLSGIGNTMFETNADGGELVMEPKDPYFYSYTTKLAPPVQAVRQGFYTGVKDWSQKVDLSKKSRLKLDNELPYRRRYVFKKDSNDKTAEAIEKGQQFRLYEARFDLPTERFKVSEKVLENPFFGAQLHIFDGSIMHPDSQIVPQIPILWNEDFRLNPTSDERADDFVPRMLYWAGARSNASGGSIWIKVASGPIKLDTPEAFQINYNDRTGADPNLTWHDAEINGFVVPGLLSVYHWRDLCREWAGKYIDDFVYLDDLDINQLTFRDKIRIYNDVFELLEVTNYNPLTPESTKVALRYDKRDDVLSRSNIQNSPLLGVISREV